MTISHPCGIDIQVQVAWDGVSFDDITSDVRFLEIQTCNRSRVANTFDPGSMRIQVNNNARKYDPTYTSGPFYGDLKPGKIVEVNVGAGLTRLFTGYVDRFEILYDRSNNDSTVILTVVDPLAYMANVVVPAGVNFAWINGPSTTLDFLDSLEAAAAAVGSPGFANDGSGGYVARMSESWDNSRQYLLLDLARQAADLEQGFVHSGRSSIIYVQHRHWFKQRTGSATSQATVGTGGLPFLDIEARWDADEIVTAVSMSSADGDTAVAVNAAGITEYGTRYATVSYDNLPALSDEVLEGAANTMLALRSGPSFRVESLSFRPAADAGWVTQVVQRNLLDRVTVTFTPTGLGSALSADYFIDGMTHQITPGDWLCSWSLMAAAPFDDAVGGALFIVGSSLVDGTDVVGL